MGETKQKNKTVTQDAALSIASTPNGEIGPCVQSTVMARSTQWKSTGVSRYNPSAGGKTCEEAHQDGHGTTWTKPCNILQVKTEILSGLDAEIAALEKEKGELKHRMCSPNPCENNGHCDTTETLTEGVLIPSASCRCGAGITGPRCGTKVEGY